MDKLLTSDEAAAVIGVKPGTLRNWRVRGDGPVFTKVGRRAMYEPADVETYKAANRFRANGVPATTE